MKKLLILILCLSLCLPACAEETDDFEILTSFYPLYILTVNIAGGIEGVTLRNMAEQNVGCLHDYSLRTGDMRMISHADIVIVNGAGMESFLDTIVQEQGKPVITASEGIGLIRALEEEHDGDAAEEEEEHHHHHHGEEESNSHVWMSPKQAMVMVENIAEGLSARDPAHAAAYRANAERYLLRLQTLDETVTELLSDVRGGRLVTSHPAFEYLARDYGLEIIASLGQEPGEMPRTHDMAELVDTVREMGVPAVFVEKAYSERGAEVLARETGIPIYTLDSLTAGELTETAYEEGILADAAILKEALADAR